MLACLRPPANLVNIAVDCSSPLSGFAKIAAVTEVRVGFLTEFWRYLRVRKKFWMLPILIIMAVPAPMPAPIPKKATTS